MLVHDIARRSGFSAHTIRYYTRIGLLRPSKDPENGYQRFDRDDLERLHFVREARELGLTLNETRHLLSAPPSETSCEDVFALLCNRLAEIRAELLALRSRESKILGALNGCSKEHCGLPFDFPCRRGQCAHAAHGGRGLNSGLDLTAGDRSSNQRQERKSGHSEMPSVRNQDWELEHV